jgi:phosphatidylglycerol:prolipoprotein diacylglycerol transferase
MCQVLFWIPLKFGIFQNGIPIYGFGMMLFVAFVVCSQLVVWMARREGFDKDRIYDMAFMIFAFGIIGARIVFMIQYHVPFWDFFKIWEGGIVFYGSAVGGWVGYVIYRLWTRNKYHIATWKLADVVAPTVCIGLAVGRIGCLLNGCCYGHVCPDCKWPQFPTMTAPSRELVVEKGFQTTAGFATDPMPLAPATVTAVEPHSPAAAAGLKVGDVITEVRTDDIREPVGAVRNLEVLFSPRNWPRGQSNIALTVQRGGKVEQLPAFTPRTLPLHPTQLYETISMALLFVLLLAFYPYRRWYGEVFVLLMLGYAVHRFLNESLRNDTDPVFKSDLVKLTLSQVGSILVFAAGIALWLYLRTFTKRLAPAAKPSPA